MSASVSSTATGRKPRLLVLLGPTAVGKTALSLLLARQFNCEIISGDSMQVYRGMDIGTAKVLPEEQQRIPHHMIDIRNPDEPFSAADFQSMAKACIQDIHERGKLPFVVGGTGLYIESLCFDYQFSEGASDEAFREEQRLFALEHGPEALLDKLRAVDPITASRLHVNDQRRIVRALEVYHLSGISMSEHQHRQKKDSPYEYCMVGLTMDRDLLYKRIEARVDIMLQDGLVEEVQGLLDQGYSRDLVSMQGLGYKEIAAALTGEMPMDTAVSLLKQGTRRFAKRQLSWFRHMKEIEWVDVTEHANLLAHLNTISGIITRKFPNDESNRG
ncbi:tRNA (adenosine(37)-N6)-dimethylallyltransferase MiaA [Paenibacillus sp. y28]|uniref:tRNA (adenosine(37)-N6)-dimethylallyltransferase MiaA n=1 Tax=Paenibacillus sp. y28 TaxID=3129110 RepID=UPI00301B31C6